jgi:pimeloyl-ACP methyl ester carboxylesterase/uncharacterized damage-inducible protein DinB
MADAPIVLVPGFWLGAWAWDEVAAALRTYGHDVTAVTLPGLDPADDRTAVTFADHVDAICAAVTAADTPVVLAVHSGAGFPGYAASDRLPDRIAAMVYVDTGPGKGAMNPGMTEPDLPLAPWDELDENLDGLTDEHLARFRERAVPQPGGVLREGADLTNDARLDLPSTVICTSMPSEQIKAAVAEGQDWLAGLAELRNVTWVDLPTSHWPMWSRPGDLAAVISKVSRGRLEPPLQGDETATLIGSLERQRATFAWKCGGLDAAGLNATVGASAMTLGGLLKHLAVVEDMYFSVRLAGREPLPAFADVDWENDPEWEWRTAADDAPEDLLALWQQAVSRSRTAFAEALANGGLDQPVTHTPWPEKPRLRRMLVDLVEEYARHTGHADLLRESVDGVVGEDPPA